MDRQNPEPADDEATGPSIEQAEAEQADARDDSAYNDPLGGLPIA
ncbi:MAG TPA: hypothetical protein VIL55_10315 [Naasia sp.]|jgi:hypothetical protein